MSLFQEYTMTEYKSSAPHEGQITAVKNFLRLFSRGSGVEFRFDGQPQTDGKTVCLGNIAPGNEFEVRAIGHGIHEMMHVLRTDFGSIPDNPKPIVKTLINVLEDVRIDSLGAAAYQGYLRFRQALSDILDRDGSLHASNPSALKGGQLFCVWLHAALLKDRIAWANRHFAELDERIRKQLNDDELLKKALQIANKVFEAPDTACVVALAQSISRLLTANSKLESPEGSFACACIRLSEEEAQSFIEKMDAACVEGSQDRSAGDTRQDGTGGTGYSQWQAYSGGTLWKCSEDDPTTTWDTKSYVEEFRAATASLKKMTAVFRKLFACKDRNDEAENALYGCELSGDFIGALASKSDNVFATQATGKAQSGMVEILVDRSGSMGLEALTEAKIATGALISALAARRGVEQEVAVYPGPIHGMGGKQKLATATVLPKGDTNLRAALERLATVNSYGGTPLWNAIEWAQSRFKTSSARVKLLVLITDGIFPRSLAEKTEKTLNAQGIELAVLTIEAQNQGLARNQCHVTKAEEIGPALVTLMKRCAGRRMLSRC